MFPFTVIGVYLKGTYKRSVDFFEAESFGDAESLAYEKNSDSDWLWVATLYGHIGGRTRLDEDQPGYDTF